MPLPAPGDDRDLAREVVSSCSSPHGGRESMHARSRSGLAVSMSERIENSVVAELTLDEKAALVAGVDLWHTAAVERLGIPALKVTDGPSGARGERWSGRPSATFPCGTALGATWNPELVARGRASGSVARRGARRRTCCSRRPSTSIAIRSRVATSSATPKIRSSRRAWRSRTSPACSRRVSACTVKHFVANDSEFERMTISSEVDERTLREISLVPFEAAVREAGTWSVMTAYNRVNGTYCSEHAELLAMLRRASGASTASSCRTGTARTAPCRPRTPGSISRCPGPPQWFGAKLADAVRAGEVDGSRRRRQGAARARAARAHRPARRRRGPAARSRIDDPNDRAVARRAAAESFVLLQNRARRAPARADGDATLAVDRPERRPRR